MVRVTTILMIALAIGGVLALVWLLAKGKDQTEPGFRDVVRNPQLMEIVNEQFAARKRATANLANESPERLVEMLLNDEQRFVAKSAINEMGSRAAPALIRAVSDPKYRRTSGSTKSASSQAKRGSQSPLVDVLECLSSIAPAEAASAIAPLAHDEDKEIRKHAALALGAIGNDAAVESFTACCSDQDDYVRSYALMGALRAIKAGRVTERFRAGAYQAIVPLVYRRDMTVSGNAPRCLLGLDRERAVQYMTQPENLAAGRQGLQYSLRALREHQIPVEEQHLLNLASSLESKVAEHPSAYVLSETLLLLARVDTDAARASIERATRSASRQVREAAAEAEAARCGLEDPFGYAFDQLEEHDWDGITEPQRLALAVRIYINEVNNGGMTQYFFNSSGDQWHETMAGLKAIGAEGDAALLQKALDLFGPAGPSVDREERGEQLSRVVKNDEEIFSPLEKTFYEDKADCEVLLLRYMTRNAAHFKAASP